MKKFILMLLVFPMVNIAAAQGTKNFFSDVKVNLSVGLSYSQCDKKFSSQKFGISLAVDAQKPIAHFPNEASTIYGLVGLHFDQKGGKTSSDVSTIGNRSANISAGHIKIPVRGGFSYQFKKCSLFFDLGPYVSFMTNSEGENDINFSSTEFGIGSMLGIKFKRFAISFGVDRGLTNFATYRRAGEEIKMINTTSHIDLRWTLGKK